ncbi:MAG: bifunctional folylpolyglutamate synthase/dihydrofolate synthase [Pseudoprimorskyibacter sp.]|nr:bifunctional folylpolyglutamate synthase/dihydrofolate synthase [Pseudoprimorskyibacter sp.]
MTDTSDVILTRMMSLHPKLMDLTLDRVWHLLDLLGNPQDRLPPVIHIAGTNGKGSTQAMLRAGFEAAGKQVHAFTSPHLVKFNERIRLAGELISEPELSELLDECYVVNGGRQITFFEITTCAALLAFSRVPADVCLLEVGLGGRLDATNVVANPALTIITPVSLDHQQFLGNTLAEIASEKAGIIKPKVTCVVGPQKDEALDVIEARAARLGAPLLAHGQDWHVQREHGRLAFQDDHGLLDLPAPVLPGAHQFMNAGAALAALRQFELGGSAFEGAMSNAVWPARLQRLRIGNLVNDFPTSEIWLDGGHNPDAGQAIASHLSNLPKRATHVVCGMLNTKDVQGYLRPISSQANSLTAVSIPGEPNTLSGTQTRSAALAAGFENTFLADNVKDALSLITARDASARILICGSLYLAGRVLAENT